MKKQCKTCQYRKNKPLTLKTIKNHIYNNQTIGIYPINEDETCYFLAFDFDDKKEENHIKEDVLAFTEICDEYNIPIAIEKSRSGKGIHCWLFFEDKIKCITARKLGILLLSKTLEIRDSIKVDSFDRMFPNQDYLPKGGYGNLIALPFQSEPLKYGNTLFVDRNFITIKKQWGYLSSLKKMNEAEVLYNINKLSNNTINICNEEFNIKIDLKDKEKNNFKSPKEINIILDNMINIDKENLNAGVKNSFRRIASFANPEFYKKQRMRMSVHNIPIVIDCSQEDEKYLKLPRGTFEYLKILCSENNIKMNIIDNRNEGTYIDFKFKGRLREEQKDALENILLFENGILKAPTGFGKTITCCKLIAERKTNTLIITEKLQLLNQWRQRIKDFLNVSDVVKLVVENT